MKTGEIAKLFDVSYQTVYNWTDRGILKLSSESTATRKMYDDDNIKKLLADGGQNE